MFLDSGDGGRAQCRGLVGGVAGPLRVPDGFMRPPQCVLRLVLRELQRLPPGGRGGSVQPGAGLVLGSLRLVGLLLGELRVMSRVRRQRQSPGMFQREIDEIVQAETGREMVGRVGLLLGDRGQHHPQ